MKLTYEDQKRLISILCRIINEERITDDEYRWSREHFLNWKSENENEK